MKLFFEIFGYKIPSYGLLIATGVILGNIIIYFYLKRKKMEYNDFIILEAYGGIGAIVGSKLLYLIISFRDIKWQNINSLAKFNSLMSSGFVFYGGLILGVALVLIFGKVHKIDSIKYLRECIFIIPFVHAFGRIGCFMAGCCYGVPYNGKIGVIFPKDSFALSGIKLLPIQLIEAICLIIISAVIFYLHNKKHIESTIEIYLILYSITRFIIEFYRYDSIRGKLFLFSTSQWISLVIFLFSLIYLIRRRKNVLF